MRWSRLEKMGKNGTENKTEAEGGDNGNEAQRQDEKNQTRDREGKCRCTETAQF